MARSFARILPLFFFATSLTAAGCLVSDAGAERDDPEATSAEDAQLTASAASTGGEVRVRVGELTVWVKPLVKPAYVAGELVATIEGRASRDLADVFSFVPDDAFGNATLTGKRTFSIALRGGSELNSILSGLPLFVRLESGGRTWFASIDLGARFARFAGDSGLFVESAIRPVYFEDGVSNLRYRGRASAPGATSLTASTDDDSDGDVLARGAGKFDIDWDYNRFQLVFDYPEFPVFFSAFGGPKELHKTAGVDLVVGKVGLTTQDPYEVWPTTSCSKSVRACLQKLPAGTKDLGACGTYRQVARCK